jgi:hypothetical protein
MAPTAADYAWVGQWIDEVSETYCLTLARGLTPELLLDRLGTHIWAPSGTSTEMSLRSFDGWDGSRLIGATTVHGADADWALGLELISFLGVTPAAIVPLSAGTRVVSHHRDLSSVQDFYWAEDGDIRLFFQSESPAWREGSTPDALTAEMRLAGFDLREGAERDEETDVKTEATFALAEHLTGVRLTSELLNESVYLWGVTPERQAR